MELQQLPQHVRDAFHAPNTPPRQLGVAWDYGWRVGNVAFSQVIHPDRSAWSARVRDKLQPQGLRVVRPLKSTDGRYINAGWRANSFEEGRLARRVDETVVAALRLDTALADIDVPDSFSEPDSHDLFSLADHSAWAPEPMVALGVTPDAEAVFLNPAQLTAQRLLPKIVLLLRDIDAPIQVTHADMFATTIYSGNQMPVVTDLVGVARPYGYTAAVCIVDALLAGAVDEGIIDRFSHIQHRDQLLLRALAYRIAVHALHPESTSNTGTNLEWVSQTIMSRASVTL
ncbi:TIGR02569 family protein [Corynebacterium diphtheriae]|nr:TIGR02569 family protein [Corynebacterium diphtheriae]